MLSKLAITIALACGLPLAGRCSAQGYGRPSPSSRQAYFQQPAEENIPLGSSSEALDGGQPAYDDGGMMWDEAGDTFPYGPDGCGYDCNSLDCDAEAIIPDGFWNNRGPNWYTSAAVTLLQKSAPSHQGTQLPIATLVEQRLVNGQIVSLRPVVMGTAGLDTTVSPGLRLTVGRNLFEDIINRQHAVEFNFIGLNHWSTSGLAIGQPEISTSTLFRAANLWSFFPFSVNAFNDATQMRMLEKSSFNNFEVNYRITRLPRPDRVAQLPDGAWMQVGTPCLTHSLLAGLRVVTFNDDFHWFSINDSTSHTFLGTYNVRSTNTLIGAQFGGDLTANYNIFTAGIRGKAGVYHNFTTQSSDVQIVDPVQGNSSGAGTGSVGTTAFVGDLGLFTTARLAEQAYFRFSYDFLWLGGVANAPDQLQYTTNISSVVRKNGFLLFQGVSLGFDFCW